MMVLSLMQAVVATVNEQWASDLADELLLHWEHDSARAKYWRASANFIFFFQRAGQDYVLRFNHASERSVAAIQAEIDYVKWLNEQGIRVAKPVRSTTGKYVESIPTALSLFHAVVFASLPGKQLDLDQLTPDQVGRWGKALGEVHRATAHFANPGRPTWQDHLAWLSEILPTEEKAAWQTLDQLRQQLEQLPINAQNFGLIHFDFELDNLIWDADRPAILDFDDCAAYWFVADIAFALRDLFDDSARQVNLRHASYLHFIQGYRSVRPIADEELALIPLFLRLHHLISFARLHRAITPTNPVGDSPRMAELRGKLTAKMQRYRQEFSA